MTLRGPSEMTAVIKEGVDIKFDISAYKEAWRRDRR